MINSLKKAGMKIIFFTARGSETGKNWENLTKKQLFTLMEGLGQGIIGAMIQQYSF